MRWLAALALALVACGGGDNGPTGSSPDLTGTWSGTTSATGTVASSIWRLTQSGSSLTGTFDLPPFTNVGAVTGTVSGNKVTLTGTLSQTILSGLECSPGVKATSGKVTVNVQVVTVTNMNGTATATTTCTGQPAKTETNPITLRR